MNGIADATKCVPDAVKCVPENVINVYLVSSSLPKSVFSLDVMLKYSINFCIVMFKVVI